MKARATIEAEVGPNGSTRFSTLRSESPLLLRKTPGAIFLVGGAAGPLGGDHTELDIVVRAGASVVLRSAAASLALPGAGPSVGNISVRVEDGARLSVDLEPLVSVVGSDHLQSVRIDLLGSARLRWRERFVLGRSGEPPGLLRTSFRVQRDGLAVLHQDVVLDASANPAILSSARALISDVVVGVPSAPDAVHWAAAGQSSRVALAADVTLASALGDELLEAEAALIVLGPTPADVDAP